MRSRAASSSSKASFASGSGSGGSSLTGMTAASGSASGKSVNISDVDVDESVFAFEMTPPLARGRWTSQLSRYIPYLPLTLGAWKGSGKRGTASCTE